jgi:hypothetical protein
MARPADATVLLDPSAVAGLAALRAGLLATRLAPTPLPTNRRGRDAVLRGLAEKPRTVAFFDISHGGTTTPAVLPLDGTMPRDESLVGSDAVAWMARHFKRSTSEALALGQALASLGLLVHVAHEHPFLDDKLYYRFAVSPAAEAVDLGDLLAALRAPQGVPVADRSHLGKVCALCRVGSDAVELLVSRHGLPRHGAWLPLHRLMQFGLIEHVTHSRPFIDGHCYDRFAGLPVDGNEP